MQELSQRTGFAERTIRGRIKKGNLSKPHKINGHAIGWRLSLLKAHPNFKFFFEGYTPQAPSNASRKQKEHSKPKTRKQQLIRSGIYQGHPINCAKDKPSYSTILRKLIPDLDQHTDRMSLPVGCVLTLTNANTAANQLKRLKDRIGKAFNLPSGDIYHWHKKEVGKESGEHSHVVLLFDATLSPQKIKHRLVDITQRMGKSVYLDAGKVKNSKGIHIIRTKQDKEGFIYHASYLAKVKTAKGNKPSFARSRNLTSAN